jgi:hypothetical protein
MSSIAISSRYCGDGDDAGFLDNFVDADFPMMAIHCASCFREARLQNECQQSTVPLLFLVFWPARTIPPFASRV